MSSFHLFPLLPLEIRQRIWELSMEPRNLPYGPKPRPYFKISWPAPAPIPPVLQACNESRTYLQRHYAKAFQTQKDPNRYVWVNVEIDSIYIDQYHLEDLAATEEASSIRQLVISGQCVEHFWYNDERWLREMNGLQTVTILYHESAPEEKEEDWCSDWDEQMRVWYSGDFVEGVVQFDAKVVHPMCPPFELNRHNYKEAKEMVLKIRRAALIGSHEEDRGN
ncbi:hypothetical protein CKAH01_09617 [Colletotrichum kahawae]|uniref:2EXR domain-containing protein n=1 Tax=Colletotrichum kahawae TaxID=34407 RepID=A0AAE0CYG4_COLKA|nr:hypothetical protein CKAH01_09617 [Colletotrichum kahawae]